MTLTIDDRRVDGITKKCINNIIILLLSLAHIALSLSLALSLSENVFLEH